MTFLLPQSVTQDNVMQVEKEGLLNLANMQTVDCRNLQYFDSSVLALLLSWQKRLQAHQHHLELANPPEKLKVLAGVYGVAPLLGLS